MTRSSHPSAGRRSRSQTRASVHGAAPQLSAQPRLRELIDIAMDFERRTMQLYCRFETSFSAPKEVATFWFDMAQHESRHFGALALVAGLLDESPERQIPAAGALTGEHIEHFERLLSTIEAEARQGVSLARALEMALDIESSEIEDLVLDLLSALRGEAERERALQVLIHDLGDLSYMIEKYTADRDLLKRVDRVIESELSRLHRGGKRKSRRAATPAKPRK